MAHIRAVGQVVGAVLADEQLIQKGGFVAGAAGGVEDALVGGLGGIELLGDECDRVVPADRLIVGAVFFEHHWGGDAADIVEPEVGLLG